MNHLDSETLVLVAMSEAELSGSQRKHLESCPACTRELLALRHTVAMGRSARTVELVAPSEKLWGRIHGALGLSPAVAMLTGRDELGSAGRAAATADAPGETSGLGSADPAGPAGAGAGSGGPGPSTASTASRTPRWRGWIPLVAAAGVVGLVGGAAAGIWWQSSRAPAAVPFVAEASLEALPGWQAAGHAYVEQAADGLRDVAVDLSITGGADVLREVWLVSADGSGLVSIGFLDGAAGRFTIPDEIDLAAYPFVDVSAEPDDGNPAHSGDSIVRGQLH